jgi:gas vesicle protein
VPEALIGVVVGGLIAWIAPLLTLRYSERKWRFEAKLNYLKAERDRFEKLYESALEKFVNGMAEGRYSINTIADFLVLMPKEIGDMFEEWMKKKEKDESEMRVAHLEMAAAMKRDLAKRDAEIKRLLDQ